MSPVCLAAGTNQAVPPPPHNLGGTAVVSLDGESGCWPPTRRTSAARRDAAGRGRRRSRPRCRGSSRRRFPATTAWPGTGAISRAAAIRIAERPLSAAILGRGLQGRRLAQRRARSAGTKAAKRPSCSTSPRRSSPGQSNRLAVRVLNPTHQPIDGIVLERNAPPQQGPSLRRRAAPGTRAASWIRWSCWSRRRSASPTSSCGPTGRRA